MEYKQFKNLVSQRKQTVIIITVLFLIAASLLTFLQPLKYSATSTLLVVQNYGPNTDAYNVSRSNQFLSNLLAQVVYSDSFYEKVLTSGYNIDKSIFPADANKRKKEWQRAVYTHAVADTGTITLKIYHQNKAVAMKLNQAIAYTLMTKHSQYHGLGDNVQIKIINDSTLSDWPVKPNIALNLLLSLAIGLIASLYFIYLFPDKKLGFDLARRSDKNNQPDSQLSRQAEITINEQSADWPRPRPEIRPEPVLAYEQLAEDLEGGRELEEIGEGEDDEFEPYFRGNINNVIQK